MSAKGQTWKQMSYKSKGAIPVSLKTANWGKSLQGIIKNGQQKIGLWGVVWKVLWGLKSPESCV